MSDPPATTEAYHSLNLRGVKTELYIALVIYGVLFGVCVFGLIRSLTKSFQYSWFKKLFFLFLATFVAARLVFFTILDQQLWHRRFEDSSLLYALSRLSVCVFFTAFTLILCHWEITFRKNYFVGDTNLIKKQLGVFLVANGIFYAIVIGSLIFDMVHGSQWDVVWSFSLTLAVFSTALLSIAFLVHIWMLSKAKPPTDGPDDSRGELQKLVVATVLFIALTVLRLFFLMWSLLFGTMLPEALFLFLEYVLPEVGVCSVILYLSQFSRYRTFHLEYDNIPHEKEERVRFFKIGDEEQEESYTPGILRSSPLGIRHLNSPTASDSEGNGSLLEGLTL